VPAPTTSRSRTRKLTDVHQVFLNILGVMTDAATMVVELECVLRLRTKGASDSGSNPPPIPIRFRHRLRPTCATTMNHLVGRPELGWCGTRERF